MNATRNSLKLHSYSSWYTVKPSMPSYCAIKLNSSGCNERLCGDT